MKIAVLGGGTAGFVAAAHLTRHLPEVELLHVFDSRIPTIGVGEGTTPQFPQWFEEVTGLDFNSLAARCRATLKKGLRFEGWGVEGSPFVNRFQPTRLFAYHFDAGDLTQVLGEHIRGQRVDAKVEQTETLIEGVRVRLEDRGALICDYVFDARGFPKRTADKLGDSNDVVRLDWVPTGKAMMRWLPQPDWTGVTRAIARPHGWVFQIPLQGRTSCGYIFNPRISSDAEVADDFTEFLRDEGVVSWSDRGTREFPNFVRRNAYDGRVFSIGNAAAFVEPLEGLTICTAIALIRSATRLIADRGSQGAPDRGDVEAFNRWIRSFNIRNSLFISWHYACGSRWDTPFWRHARRGLEIARDSEWARPYLAEMDAFLEAGRNLPGFALPNYEDQDQWDREVYPLLKLYRPFGNFSELNFAQVGHGIGYYDVDSDRQGPTAAIAGRQELRAQV